MLRLAASHAVDVFSLLPVSTLQAGTSMDLGAELQDLLVPCALTGIGLRRIVVKARASFMPTHLHATTLVGARRPRRPCSLGMYTLGRWYSTRISHWWHWCATWGEQKGSLRDQQAWGISLAHSRPLLLQAASDFVAVHDLLSGTRLGRLDLRSPAVETCFSPDGAWLVIVVQVHFQLG